MTTKEMEKRRKKNILINEGELITSMVKKGKEHKFARKGRIVGPTVNLMVLGMTNER